MYYLSFFIFHVGLRLLEKPLTEHPNCLWDVEFLRDLSILLKPISFLIFGF